MLQTRHWSDDYSIEYKYYHEYLSRQRRNR